MSNQAKQTRLEYAESAADSLLNHLKEQFPKPLKISSQTSAAILKLNATRSNTPQTTAYGESAGQTVFEATPFGENAKLFMDNLAHWMHADGFLFSSSEGYGITRKGLERLSANFMI